MKGIILKRELRFYLRANLRFDLQAGLTVALIAIPQSLAYALIAGINPIYGLAGVILPAIVGSLFGYSTWLVTGFTNAIAMATAGVLSGYVGSSSYLHLVFALAIISGVIKLIFGIFKLGWVTRFISNSVLTGFLLGLGLLIIINQIAPLTGIPAPEDTRPIITLVQEVIHIGDLNIFVFLTGLVSIAVLFLSRLLDKRFPAELITILIGGLFVHLTGWQARGVRLIGDLGDLPAFGFRLFWPDLTFTDWEFLIPAGLAVGMLSVMEALTVAKSIALAKGATLDVSRELIGQGLASLTGGFFQAPPSSGSPSRTAVNLGAGARTRMASVFSGLMVLPFIFLVPNLINYIPLASLAAVVVISATRIVNWSHVGLTWRSKGTSRFVMLVTFGATLLMPLQQAIFLGALLSIMIYLFESSQLNMNYLCLDEKNRFLQNNELVMLREDLPVVLMSAEGPMHFAAVDVLERHLRDAIDSGAKVVILRLRRTQVVASSAITVIAAEIRHAEKLGVKMLLCGIDDHLMQHLRDAGVIDLLGEDQVFVGERLLFQATRDAVDFAEEWLSLTK